MVLGASLIRRQWPEEGSDPPLSLVSGLEVVITVVLPGSLMGGLQDRVSSDALHVLQGYSNETFGALLGVLDGWCLALGESSKWTFHSDQAFPSRVNR